jgi:hypothetical protein
MEAVSTVYGLAITAPPARLGGAVNRVFRVATGGEDVVLPRGVVKRSSRIMQPSPEELAPGSLVRGLCRR